VPKGEEQTPIVTGWQRPKRTFQVLRDYLETKDEDLWLAIIDYWIGELFLLRSDAEARRVPPAKRAKEEKSVK